MIDFLVAAFADTRVMRYLEDWRNYESAF